jgi:vesicle coat complex subunit
VISSSQNFLLILILPTHIVSGARNITVNVSVFKKDNTTSVSKYRPIAMLNAFSKVFVSIFPVVLRPSSIIHSKVLPRPNQLLRIWSQFSNRYSHCIFLRTIFVHQFDVSSACD